MFGTGRNFVLLESTTNKECHCRKQIPTLLLKTECLAQRWDSGGNKNFSNLEFINLNWNSSSFLFQNDNIFFFIPPKFNFLCNGHKIFLFDSNFLIKIILLNRTN
jgi:hypothetical protein